MTQPHHRNRHPKYRKQYKVQSWQAYERSLIQRGDLTIWLSEDVIQSWYDDSLNQFSRPKLYSDVAIETSLTLRLLFKLPLRQTEGFLSSIFRLMNVGLSYQIKQLGVYHFDGQINKVGLLNLLTCRRKLHDKEKTLHTK